MKRLYALLLGLFPSSYREEYGDELQAVFNLLFDDALKKGWLEATNVVLREMIGLPTAILYEHLRKPQYGLAAQSSIFEKANYMGAIMKIQWADEDSWMATLASLLPLWLLSFVIMGEGFPQAPISRGLAVTAFYLAIAVSIFLLWKGWLTFDLILYSLFPFILLFIFDEIHTSYKTPFILLCALILTIGIVGYQRSLYKDSVTLAWLILLLVAIATWVLASHANLNYWHMVSDLGYVECFPGAQGCAPLAGNETPWWVLFFSL